MLLVDYHKFWQRPKARIKGSSDNSSMDYQSAKNVKYDFAFFFIFNGLSANENGSTPLCCGISDTSEPPRALL